MDTLQANEGQPQKVSEEHNFLMFVAEVSEIGPDDLEKLFYNGFDNPESLELASVEDLAALGVADPEFTCQRLKDTLMAYKSVPKPEEPVQEEPARQVVYETDEPLPNVPSDARNLHRDLLLGAQIRKPVITHRQFLEAMTHLKMTKMKLSHVVQYDTEGNAKPLLSEHCPNLSILYLQENYLVQLGQAAFYGLK